MGDHPKQSAIKIRPAANASLRLAVLIQNQFHSHGVQRPGDTGFQHDIELSSPGSMAGQRRPLGTPAHSSRCLQRFVRSTLVKVIER
jgi:hypothetical protein